MKTISSLLLVLAGFVWAARASDSAPSSEPGMTPPPPILVELKTGKITYLEGVGVKISGSGSGAKVGDVLAEKTGLETGAAPVTEVTFEDGSVMRLGEKTKISFLSKERAVRLESGTVLFYSPEGNGGISIQGGEATGQVPGSTVMGTRDAAGNFSLLVLESSGAGSLNGPNVPTTFLGVGEGATVRAVPGETPEVMDVHIDAVRDISPLFQQISTSLPSSEKIVGTTLRQADDIQGDVKLLSSLENCKLTPTDPEGVALSMICSVGPEEMGAAKNILLRPLDTAAGTESGSDQGGANIVGGFAVPADARQEGASLMTASSAPPPGSDGPGLGGEETAAGGGSPPDSQPPPVSTPTVPGFTTPF